MSLEQYNFQQRQKLQKELGTTQVYKHKPKKETEIEIWKKRLDSAANRKVLSKHSKKYPHVTWLSARWCRKDAEDDIPDHYFNVWLAQGYKSEKGVGISHVMRGRSGYQEFDYVEVRGNYFDLWDDPQSYNQVDFHGMRLEKKSDNEYALVYLFPDTPPKVVVNEMETLIQFAKSQADKVKPEDHYKNPKVYVKCK